MPMLPSRPALFRLFALLALALTVAACGNRPAEPEADSDSRAVADPARRIALIGASGNAGSWILEELVSRGHTVTAIARHPDRIARLPRVTAVAGDVNQPETLVPLLRDHVAVVSAVPFGNSDPDILIGAVRDAGVDRYIVVGGAASLTGPDGRRLLDSPSFPDAYRDEAHRGAVFLDRLRAVDDLDWTFISPSAEFIEGNRTGTFRLGNDDLLFDANGRSWISFADFAVALVDELERPAHVRERFTVGY